MRFHVHRRTWGEVYEEQWSRLKPEYRWYTPPVWLLEHTVETRERYSRFFQNGTCSVCGHVEKREVGA